MIIEVVNDRDVRSHNHSACTTEFQTHQNHHAIHNEEITIE